MMNYEWMSWNCNSTPQKIECAKIKSHYESIADLLLNHGDACNRILFGYKRSFFRRLPEKTICFSFAHRCSLQTSFSSLFGWRSVCVCVWGGGGNLGHSYPEIFRSTYFNCRRKWQFLCCILKAQLLLNSSQVANYCTYGKICNQNTLSLQYSNFFSVIFHKVPRFLQWLVKPIASLRLHKTKRCLAISSTSDKWQLLLHI